MCDVCACEMRHPGDVFSSVFCPVLVRFASCDITCFVVIENYEHVQQNALVVPLEIFSSERDIVFV